MLAPSSLLLPLLPTLFHLSSSHLSATVVVSLPFSDAAKVAAVRGSGCAVLFARTAQEVHDTVVAAHLTSLATRVPVVVFVPSEALNVESDVVVADPTGFAALAEAHAGEAGEAPAAVKGVLRRRAEPASLASFPVKLADVGAALKNKGVISAVLTPVAYAGAKDPETVLIAAGTSSAALGGLIAGATQPVGVATVDQLRPWPEAELISLVSGFKKLRTVAVVEPEGDALFADVSLVDSRLRGHFSVTDYFLALSAPRLLR